MKPGITLSQLAQEVKHAQQAAEDYKANPAKAMRYWNDAGTDNFGLGGWSEGSSSEQAFKATPPAMDQVTSYLDIPKKYTNLLRKEDPELLKVNINYRLESKDDTRLVRTLDDKMRAFLSASYWPLDNADFLAVAYPLLEKHQGEIRSCAITDTKMYLKVVFPGEAVEIKAPGVKWGVGHDPIHVLQPGLVLRNSETGHGSFEIADAIYSVHCSNMAVSREETHRKYHRISRASDAGTFEKYVTDDTRRKRNDLFWAEAKDVLAAAITGRSFQDRVNKIRESFGEVMPDPQVTMERVAKNYQLSNEEHNGILDALIYSGEPTKFGLQAAVTNYAQRVVSYDRSTELEELGGRILELPSSQWKTLTKAA